MLQNAEHRLESARDSSVDIESGYGMYGRGSNSSRVRNFSLMHSVQTGSEAHPVFFTGGTSDFSVVVKRPVGEAGHYHLVPRLKMMELYLHYAICLHALVFN
jgi:hypothetical protein